ncbi:MAG: hypothetical protein GW892_18220 [Armatimonadetes bacterium]|nr:hypothetical protein [Armatimonadota bacterium]
MRRRFAVLPALLCLAFAAAWLMGVAAAAPAAPPSKLADLQVLFERFSGHVALLPGTTPEASREFPLVQWLAQAGLVEHVKLLTAEELVDPGTFTAARFPVVLYGSNEPYLQSFRKPGDCDEALVRYLGQGGTLLVLPSGPFPFFYNEAGKVVNTSAKFGLPVCGGGVNPLPEHLRGVATSLNGPPPGRTLTFRAAPAQQVVTSLPASVPYPAQDEADQRWRGILNAPPAGARYVPVVSLHDDAGNSYGEGVAAIEHLEGRFKGARAVYVWCSLLASARTREPILAGVLHYALTGATPPPAEIGASFTARSPTVDGRLDDSCWATAAQTTRFLPPLEAPVPTNLPATTARLCWTAERLFLGIKCPRRPDRNGDDVVSVTWSRPGEANPQRLELRPQASANGLPGGTEAQSAVNGADWTAEVSVPLASLGIDAPRFGARASVQFTRTTEGNEPASLAWSPADAPGTVLLAPDRYGDTFDFYPEGTDGSPYWRITSGSWRVENGTLVGENTGDDGYLAEGAALDGDWTDCEFSVHFKVESYADNWRDGPRIGFRCNASGDGYHVNFTDRHVQVHKSILGTTTGEANALAVTPWKRDNEWHSLKVRCLANTFTGELDGEPLFSFRDDMVLDVPSYRRGGIILSARRWTRSQGDMRVRYDDVRVTPLPSAKRWSFE